MSSPRRPLVAIGAGAIALAMTAGHARWAAHLRDLQGPAIAAVARTMPAADLALSGTARHLRFPSLEDPGAPFADMPAAPDIDPGGGALAPPVELYEKTASLRLRAR